MPEARQMDPDLMRPACPDANFEKRELVEPLPHTVLGQRFPARFEPRRHAGPPDGIRPASENVAALQSADCMRN